MKSLSSLDDRQLILHMQAGDSAAFQTLYRKYWRQLFSFACQATRSTDDAKDLLQDLFAEVWQNRNSIRPDAFSVAYLYTALRHKVLDRIRRLSVREDYVKAITATASELDHSTESSILAEDFAEHLNQELNSLPDRCRLIFHLSRFEHQSIDEIAQQLQLSPQTVKNQLSKALQRLRTNLPEYAAMVALVLWLPFE